MRLGIMAALVAWAAVPAVAQDAEFEAAMEVQRCIWRCLADAGSAEDPAYGACVASQCDDGAAGGQSPAPAPAVAPGGASTGAWTYGVHPALGLSAHVQTEWGAVGLACGADPAQPASLRVTSEMFRGRGLVFVFDISPGWSEANILRGPGAVATKDRTSCGHQLWNFQSAPRMFAVDGVQDPSAVGGLGIDGPQGRYVLPAGSSAAGVPGARAISLRGSSAAIGALIAACPAMADLGCD